jgi:outer membrane cobalamin receptor
LYGSNAMLGVINVITKQASEYSGLHATAEVGIANSVRAGAGAGYQFSLFGDRADLTTALEYFERRGPDLYLEPQRIDLDPYTAAPYVVGPGNGNVYGGQITHANYMRVPSALLRLQAGDFTVNMHGRMSKTGRWLNEFAFDNENTFVEEQNLWGDVTYTKLLSPSVELSVRAYADGYGWRHDYESYSAIGCGNDAPCRQVVVRTTRWVGLETRSSFDWLRNKRLVTTIGVDQRFRDVRTKKDAFEIGSTSQRISSISILSEQDGAMGAYVQQTLQPTTWLGFNAGARVDQDVRFKPVVSPRLAAVSELWEGATLRGIYSEAFRAPGRMETDVRFSANIVPNLSPETVRSYEASLDQRIGTHRFLLGAFKTDWSDMVRRVVLTDEERAQVSNAIDSALNRNVVLDELRNISQIENYGVNAGYRGGFLRDRLTLGANVTWAHARQRTHGTSRELAVAPQLFGNAHIAYSLGARAPTIGLVAAYLDKRQANQGVEGKFVPTPYAPAQLDMRLTLTGDVVPISGLSYRLTGSYISATKGAYVAGPTAEAQAAHPAAVLDPLKQYEVFWGLQYDFDK